MLSVRSLARHRSRRMAAVVFIFCVLLLLVPTWRQHIGDALLFGLVGPSVHRSPSGVRLLGSPFDRGFDVIRHIDPLIGTVNGGHAFAGATLPYGMAKAVADTNSKAENAAGFVSDDSDILGFSHLHDAGTGGNPSMGNFALFAHPGCPADDVQQCAFASFRRGVKRQPDSARASPGYFAIGLNNSVRAEMTTTQRAALYRFTFPDAGAAGVPHSPIVLMDLADLQMTRRGGGAQVHPESGRITGHARYMPSFGLGDYAAYVCVDFRGAALRKTGVFADTQVVEEPKHLNDLDNIAGLRSPSGSAGAWVQFAAPEDAAAGILARVGVSFVSTDQACTSAAAEIPDWDMDGTVRAAQDIWREKLAPVAVDATGVSAELQTTFWSGLYRAFLSPQNYTGENPKWTSDEPYFDSFYCIWDSFRVQHPLLTILDPPAQTEMIRALLDIYRHEGKLPDCRMSFCKGYSQGGSNADVVIADAYVKQLRADINWTTAYAAVVSDAEVEPSSWAVEGRGNLVSYHAMGYIPWDDKDVNGTGPASRSISRLVEYAYDDFAIGQLAAGLASEARGTAAGVRLAAEAAKYHGRGTNWRQLWNAEQGDPYRDERGNAADSGFVGFLQPRLLNGSFRHHEPRRCSPLLDMHRCYFDTAYETYEGSPWLYSFYAPQDMRTLVARMGGAAVFARRLDYFHDSGLAYMGNEPTFLPVFQFHYAGRPGRSAYWAHRYIPDLFNASLHGIPGNDDCAMGAFSAFALLGFFPVAGQDVYLLTAPFFREVRIRAKNGADAIFRVRNFDPSYADIYIQHATLDGRPYTRSWISHDIFLRGGLLEYTVGPTESTIWGVRDEDLPPSYYDS